MKRFEILFRLCFCIASLVFIARFCQKQTDTFTIPAISSNRPFNPEFETRSLNENELKEIKVALSQPYVYFGRGGQAYAFFSADGNYVVKFFKQRLFRPSKLLNLLPLPKLLHKYRNKRNWKRVDKLQRDFFSYKVSFEELQGQTAVLYAHLNPTGHLNQKLEIIDRLGIHHFLNLDDYDFIIQRRAEKVYDRINQLMESGQIETARKTLRQVFSLISTRAKLGFRDRDPNVRTNCGLLHDRAIKIDVGRFVRNEEMKTKEGHNNELLRISSPLENWVEDYHPDLLHAFHEELNEVLIP